MSTAQLKQVATGKKDNPVASFSSFLDKFKPQMALALPKHLTADRMARLAVTAFSSTPKLQECEPKTIVAGIMTAATLGLEIGVDGQGFLVPYGRTCQFVPGWKGLVDLVSRSGRATVWTGAVFEGDEFDYALGDSPFIRHRPGEENDPDKITHVYAVGRVNGSDYPVIEVWTIRKVWKHRDKYNKVGAKHYSFRDPEMYARKVPLLQVLKYMPKSIELQNAMAIANAADNGHHAVIDGNFVTVTDPDTGATVDPSTGELTDQRAQQSDMTLPAYDDLLGQIQKADDVEVLALVMDSARDLPADQLTKLKQAYEDRKEVLM
ncbi:recombinase RecT [Burkholderia mayonis]|uniref:Recombinase RecT n=1 Tax=Burkholderia mayonis TaxID=1385591 RepID=A0A1B4G389_9BURK|nr:recombinase RecT [Burkholderia mayonis]AOJ10365.1 recombinase RecT [Burkholderia mayonis]KVE53655.1 recombinase RecT [Burkholderia mayonis]